MATTTNSTERLTFVTTVRDPVNGSFYVQGKSYDIPTAWAKNLLHQGVAVPEGSAAGKAAEDGKSLSELVKDHKGDETAGVAGKAGKAGKAASNNTSK